jgi:adenylate kinase family enzyme
MLEALKLRTLVIGNSGSGKSQLAEGLGALSRAPIFRPRFDPLERKRVWNQARQGCGPAATERWVIEGVYGWLAEGQFQAQQDGRFWAGFAAKARCLS